MKDESTGSSAGGCFILFVLCLIIFGIIELIKEKPPIYKFANDERVYSKKYTSIDLNKWECPGYELNVFKDLATKNPVINTDNQPFTITSQNRFGILDSSNNYYKVYIYADPEEYSVEGWVAKKFIKSVNNNASNEAKDNNQSTENINYRILFIKNYSKKSYYIYYPEEANSLHACETFVKLFKSSRSEDCNVFLLDDDNAGNIFRKDDLTPEEEALYGPHLYAMSTFDLGNTVLWHPYEQY